MKEPGRFEPCRSKPAREMLRRVCSHVRVVPFKRPEEVMVTEEACSNSVQLMGLLERPVRVQYGAVRSSMLVPMVPSPSLSSLPSSTPCSLVYLHFHMSLGRVALSHLSPGQHIFVSGALTNESGRRNAFAVKVSVLRSVQDPTAAAPDPDTDFGTLCALVSNQSSRWRAYFHSPSEWYVSKHYGNLLLVHKYTGVRLWTSSMVPGWVKTRLASFAHQHGTRRMDDGRQ